MQEITVTEFMRLIIFKNIETSLNIRGVIFRYNRIKKLTSNQYFVI